MTVVGQKVIHKIFGIGKISRFEGMEQNNNKYITVEFDNKTIQMPYPSSFENILTAIDPTFEEHVKELNKVSKKEAYQEIPTPITYRTQTHKPISFCATNTFIFKNVLASTTRNGVYVKGFETYDKQGRKVGITYKHRQRPVAQGQAEICFFEEYENEFGTWRLIAFDKERLSFDKLTKIVQEKGAFEATIDPRRGS